MPKLITQPQKRIYFKRREAGYSMVEACKAAGFSLTTARSLEHISRDRVRLATLTSSGTQDPDFPQPKRYEELCPEAQRAWNDFTYFQRRYFGRVPTPWQKEAADTLVKLLETQDEEYVVVNAPPSAGKSTLFTHDWVCWLIVRDRAIRILVGAAVASKAKEYCDRVRTSLSRTIPAKGRADYILAGTAFDAEATLAGDFGYFKPLNREMWTRDAFVVAQYADTGAVVEKEPTVCSYGFDQGYLGTRVDVAVWDDLVDPSKTRTQEAVERQRSDWDDLAEPRLEPGGVHVLQGQRMFANDLYRYCLDKRIPILEDEETGEVLESHPMYHHLVFKAHYEDLCSPGSHKRNAAPYGAGGCLLDPRRLGFTKLAGIKFNRAQKYSVVYQQEDTDPQDVLVPKEWIIGSDKYPGCLDENRSVGEIPSDLRLPTFSCVTVDPSPSKYWGIIWWVYQKNTELRYVIDLERKKMEAPQLLEFDPQSGQYSGILEEWWHQSVRLGHRITHVILEINAAQKFLLQYRWVHQWMALRGVLIVPHTTTRNRSDEEFGVQMIASNYMYGRVRLPFKRGNFTPIKSTWLINELTTYPHSDTDDLVMSNWFFEHNLPNIYHPDHKPTVQWRPSWVKVS